MLSSADLKHRYMAAQGVSFAGDAYRFRPYLCHLILTGSKIPVGKSHLYYLTGLEQDCQLFGQSNSNELIATEKINASVWSDLPLRGLRPSQDFDRRQVELYEAMKLLQRISPKRSAFTSDWITLIQWVDRIPEANNSLLTSSTFPSFPHCAFLSEKALRHIPPNIVFVQESKYFLLENLFHEALHQQLSSSLLFIESIKNDYDARTTSKIDVPWRNNRWEPDRVLHAAFVYANLIDLRLEFLQTDESDLPLLAVQQAIDALKYLHSKFSEVKKIFTSKGVILFEEIEDLVSGTLQRVKGSL